MKTLERNINNVIKNLNIRDTSLIDAYRGFSLTDFIITDKDEVVEYIAHEFKKVEDNVLNDEVIGLYPLDNLDFLRAVVNNDEQEFYSFYKPNKSLVKKYYN